MESFEEMKEAPGDKDAKKNVYVIGEMACSHEGDLQKARCIIDGAGGGGADAIQFQIWSLPQMVVPHHPEYGNLKKLEFSYDEWRNLFEYAKGKHPRMDVIACVYERGSVDFCQTLGVDAYKIHSSDLSNPLLVNHVAQSGKRIDLSIGASTLEEIRTAVEWIRGSSGCCIWLMYGYQSFPTKTIDVHLKYMSKLRSLFELPIGYQDHTDAEVDAAFWLPAAAIGMGVDAIEKHVTHDRSLKGVDHEAALNPDEFLRFVGMVRTIEGAMGRSVPRPFSEEELRYRIYSKKSLVASRDLEAQTVVSPDDLEFMRAESLGIPPDQSRRIVGRKLKRRILKNHLVQEEDCI